MKYLEKLPFWEDMSREEKQYVVAASRIEEYSAGAIINNSSDACLGLAYILDGEASTCILSEEGREITLYRLHSGDYSVLTASCVVTQITFDSQLVVQSRCRILVIAAYALKRLMDSNLHAKCFVLELAAERFSLVMSTMQDILFKGYDRRLASFLVREYERCGKNVINATQEKIASFTGSAREVVTRAIKRFSEEGLISYKRGQLTILDIDSLRYMM